MVGTSTIYELVGTALDCVFSDVVEEFDLKFGDISPDQVMRLQRLEYDLIGLLEEFKNQNSRDEES